MLSVKTKNHSIKNMKNIAQGIKNPGPGRKTKYERKHEHK